MTTPTVLVLQNHVKAPAGLIGERLTAADIAMDVRHLPEGDVVPEPDRPYAGLIVLGGPMHAWEDAAHPYLGDEGRLIRAFVARRAPVLGICLGAQIMAQTLGGAVWQHSVREIGFTEIIPDPAARDDPLLRTIPTPWPKPFQWHEDTFSLPAGAVLLAGNEVCRNQIFRCGPGQYGLQCHLEVDAEIITAWAIHFREVLERDAPWFLASLDRQIANHMTAAERFGRAFADGWSATVWQYAHCS